MKDILCVARRSQSESCEYFPCDQFGLKVALSEDQGNDSSFYSDVKVQISNMSDEDFLGVIHLKLLGEDIAPKFFMPGFMYNTNTADKPSSGR